MSEDDKDLEAAIALSLQELDAPSPPRPEATAGASPSRPGKASPMKLLGIDELEDYYSREGRDLGELRKRVNRVMEDLEVVPVDAGSLNFDEGNNVMEMQCFYLSLARTLLGGVPKRAVREEALRLKREVERFVLREHPEWVNEEKIGESVMAFADFLTYPMRSETSKWMKRAVVVFDCLTGDIQIYVGKRHIECAEAGDKEARLLLILHTLDHYQPLCGDSTGSETLLTLDVLQTYLDGEGFDYTMTDG